MHLAVPSQSRLSLNTRSQELIASKDSFGANMVRPEVSSTPPANAIHPVREISGLIKRTGILQAKRGIAFICSTLELNLIDACTTFACLNF
jgi:hypothetical protein